MSTEHDEAEWEDEVHKELIPKMEESAYVMSLFPRDGKPDAKFAVELGMAIMLDKPITIIVAPEEAAKIPSQLRRVADSIDVLDLNAPDANDRMREIIAASVKRYGTDD